MAVVRITSELTKDILGLAEVSFRDRMERAFARDKAYRQTHNMFQAVCDAWLENQGLASVIAYLSDDFYEKTSYIYVGSINGQSLNQQAVFTSDGNDRPVLCAMVNPSSHRYSMLSIDINHPSLQHFADHVKDIQDEIEAIQQERKNFMDTLGKLLRNSRSLKHALDQWPHLIELVPAIVIERMNEVVERKKQTKAKEAEPINVDTLNMSLTIAKISARSEQ
jgi:hypothetical protein